MGYEYISFSNAVIKNVGHDFSFLDSDQFPADVKIRRVDYNPGPNVALRVVIESASYTKTIEEALEGSGLTIMCYCYAVLMEGKAVQFMDYNPIPEDFWPTGTERFGKFEFPKPLYAKLFTRRVKHGDEIV